MIYYKIKSKYTGHYFFRPYKGRLIVAIHFSKGELFTPKEKKHYCIPDSYFDVININSHNTFKMFGIRFEKENNND